MRYLYDFEISPKVKLTFFIIFRSNGMRVNVMKTAFAQKNTIPSAAEMARLTAMPARQDALVW